MATITKEKEPVLLVQPRNAKSGYATLLKYNCVPRKWHVEGRYGSRTHRVGDRIGLPLLQSSQTIESITSLLKEEEESLEKHKEDRNGKENNHSSDQHNENDAENLHYPSCSDLKELLSTSKLIYEIPTISNRIPKYEKVDATIHPERAPTNFSSLVMNILQNHKNLSTSNGQSHNNPNAPATDASSLPPTFRFAELFSGIGGFGIALEALGGECVFASEIAPLSVHTYCKNMKTIPPHGVAGDIWEVDTGHDIPYHDLLVGGFPCQPFSSLGIQPGLHDDKTTTGRITQNNENGTKRKRNINDNNGNGDDEKPHDETESVKNDGRGRGQLFTQIVRVLEDCQPQAFLLENVPGLIHTDNGKALQTIISALEDTGYHVSMEVCSSRGLTVQSRKRLYIVGLLREELQRQLLSSNNSGNDNDKSNGDSSLHRATTNTSDEALICDDSTEQQPQQQHKHSAFQFPFIPDLGLRARHVLHTDHELESSFISTGVPLVLSDDSSNNNSSKHDTTAAVESDNQDDGSRTSNLISPLSSRPVEMYRLTDAQFDQLRNRSKSWKPAKLAWDDTTCDTIDSHYGITVGKGNSQLVPSPAPFHPRRFTPRECARVMGFPESFQLGFYVEAATARMVEENIDHNPPAMPVIVNKGITSTKEFNTYIKEQYHMLGNAVCPPVIAALAGAILNRCHLSDIPADNTAENWVARGLSCAIQLALEAIPTDRREQVEEELRSTLSGST